jgi:ligand-binding SRPBCC domain-containing protein
MVAAKSMPSYRLEREQWLPKPIAEVFSFFSRPENLQVITPPWLDFRMVESPQALVAGSLIRYRLRWRGIPIRWTTEISEWNPPHRFVDREIKGPYALWNHEHWFEAGAGGTTMRDRVTYALPFGFLGQIAYPVVRRDVERIFDFRAQIMSRLFPS